jgi:hypothetical protein
MPKRTKISLDQLVDGIDLPHKRHEGWKWMKTGPAPTNKPGFSRDRLIFYAGQLRDLGMGDTDIACLISDLYWDAYTETEKNGTFAKFQNS